MALDPEELVALANHGIMKLRSAVARGMMLPPEERDAAAIIVRKGALAQSTLDFEQIKQLAARWKQEEQPAPSSQTTPCHR
ncbi:MULTISPECIES: hypothetical protein [unclassified Bradyrhizobium]|uniref:hypothetical protein n=1 Tax=unclassified Bradyrhizobium TaxID=2631580 RepID=UPI001BA7D025|nr:MULTISPECIES: hypothetical protein [unclassified Bradyrhizobium]MBR1229989.1 hypothetical protein [Bradyrhizobium sp. AUGA SZCCT0176]MBR1230880.1 hypothetical protein [Bradyrhizobium sp. AUGA SZCCT0182]MBR1269078.1 hypothetical protein [Bradyrhizobium sp. AUGA SZCCT0222]MBR1297757.1 hypothetical protein [Bradyrhizobium sp. AUGA SZCCT0042]